MEKNILELIGRLTGESKFSLYVPHFKWIEALIAGSDSRCIEVNILEEGSVAYGDKHDLLKWDMGRRKSSIRWFVQSFLLKSSLSCVLSKISTYYCLSKFAFKWTSSKVLIDRSSIFPYKESIRRKFENGVIVLIDSAPVHGWIDPKHYIRRLALIIDKLGKQTSRTWFKRHPIYDDETKATSNIRAWLDRLDEREEVDKCLTPIEDIIGSCKDIKTVSLLSSVGRYAKMCGVPTYSWFSFLDPSCIQANKIPIFRDFEERHNSIEEIL
jgi:hypothetical protein